MARVGRAVVDLLFAGGALVAFELNEICFVPNQFVTF